MASFSICGIDCDACRFAAEQGCKGCQAEQGQVFWGEHLPPCIFRLPGHKYNMPIMVTLSELKFTKKFKIACSVFCEATISKLIF